MKPVSNQYQNSVVITTLTDGNADDGRRTPLNLPNNRTASLTRWRF